ncbi:hypothetical protein JQ621_33065 [Bradyrhizobium manausense]|uniref:hypothetical protein n=1 Tax=Bradyrhizobium manausense TaxID=989370 RepID=UPI001BACD061|nr:hypothetical protein [Bradyrhizobium manausense]MBR1092302.1 hypothetical protein [Bradyrhizobium manausense]
MLAFLILLFLTGAVFAWRFRVFAIAFMSGCALIGALMTLTASHGILSALLSASVLAAAPQLGYATGLATRLILASQRMPQTGGRRDTAAQRVN